ncbi:unnamed protein product [Lupinus luteus]|uniref:Uncharacterized protein n=1 Tax=Lupinus luteus TaxID=3873 RepID=A0AAV1XSP2_LUPLU
MVKAGTGTSTQANTQIIDSQVHVPNFVFQTAEECPMWLRESYIGILSDQTDCTSLKEKLHLDGFYSIHVTSLGGRSVLPRGEEDGEIEPFFAKSTIGLILEFPQFLDGNHPTWLTTDSYG